jgi:5-methylcytosine-specific restriction endonuclease McrA
LNINTIIYKCEDGISSLRSKGENRVADNIQKIKDDLVILLADGKNNKELSEELGINRKTMGMYIKVLNLDNVCNEVLFIKTFNKYYSSQFLYIGGYEHSDGKINMMCKRCGYEFKRVAQSIRKNRNIICSGCSKDNKQAMEIIEAAKKELDKQVRHIMIKVKNEVDRLSIKVNREPNEYKCIECDNTFISLNKKQTCSERCSKKRYNRRKELSRRKRLKQNGDIDYSITIDKLIRRDKGKCSICGSRIDKKDFIETEEGYFIAGDSYPSIDHILPVSKGGTHTWDNVQLAHRSCNTDKRDNETYEQQGQLTLSI